MNKNDIAIATMTWARDENEELLLRDALTGLSKLNLPVFITDGGSGDDFINFIKGFPNFTVLSATDKGVWPQVLTSLKAAHNSGARFIMYTEPDKRDFFKTGLPGMLNKLVTDEKSGIVLAVRSVAGFKSYPTFQQMTETTINNCCAEIIGIKTDYTYGPFLLNSKMVPYLHKLRPSIGWGWRPYACIMASRLGYNVDSFKGAFFCPVDQRDDNVSERVYRMRQLAENIEAVVLGKTVLLGN
jgi:hypothetical protein